MNEFDNITLDKTSNEYLSLIGQPRIANSLTTIYILQIVHVTISAFASGTTIIPLDDTIPQQTEGDQYLTASITPKMVNSILEIEVVLNSTLQSTVAIVTIAALFLTLLLTLSMLLEHLVVPLQMTTCHYEYFTALFRVQ